MFKSKKTRACINGHVETSEDHLNIIELLNMKKAKELEDNPEDYIDAFDKLKEEMKTTKYEQIRPNVIKPVDEITLEQFIANNKDIINILLDTDMACMTNALDYYNPPTGAKLEIRKSTNQDSIKDSLEIFNKYKNYTIVYVELYRPDAIINYSYINVILDKPQELITTLKAEDFK